jgi:hypothetical protein
MDYNFWADMCIDLHSIVIIFWGGGFFLYFWHKKFERFLSFHRTFGVIIFCVQCLFGLNCPLTLLEKYLRGINNPEGLTGEPFTVMFLRKTFGISITGTAVMIITILGTAICLIIIIHKMSEKKLSTN